MRTTHNTGPHPLIYIFCHITQKGTLRIRETGTQLGVALFKITLGGRLSPK